MIGNVVAGITGFGGASLSSYESIATATVSTPTAPITFSSIPSTFKHLQIRALTRSNFSDTSVNNYYMTVNNKTTSVYSFHWLQGNGTSATAAGYATQNYGVPSSFSPENSNTAGIMGVSIIDILDYASTSKYKTVRAFYGCDKNGSGGSIFIASGLYQETDAVSRLDFTNGINWATGTTFALYGIKEA